MNEEYNNNDGQYDEELPALDDGSKQEGAGSVEEYLQEVLFQDLITVNEAAELTKSAAGTIRAYLKEDKIPVLAFGREVKFAKHYLAEMVSRRYGPLQ